MQLLHEQKTTQQLHPRLITAMQILQMDLCQLQGLISNALLENPVLESELPHESLSVQTEAPRTDGTEDEPEDCGFAHTGAANDQQTPRDYIDRSSADYDEDLVSHLLYQLSQKRLSAEEYRWAEYVVRCLDKDGYLREDAQSLADAAELPKLLAAIRLVQSLDPAGVCARNLSECLCLQLAARGETGLAYRIAQSHLQSLGRHAYVTIAAALDADEKDVIAAGETIRALTPFPCSSFSSKEESSYLTPDVLVVEDENGRHAALNRANDFSLRISTFYRKLQKESEDCEVRRYISEKITQAEWLIRCVSRREDTILRCADEILQKQRDFFDGHSPLQPMTMQQLALATHLSVSTVSRALNGKYIQTPHGAWKMSDLFTAGLGKSGSVSSDLAKKRIAALIRAEDKRAPLSDQRLSELLSEQGIPLSRRTVAKYRDALHIPSAPSRKA